MLNIRHICVPVLVNLKIQSEQPHLRATLRSQTLYSQRGFIIPVHGSSSESNNLNVPRYLNALKASFEVVKKLIRNLKMLQLLNTK